MIRIESYIDLCEDTSFLASEAVNDLKQSTIKLAADLAPETHIQDPKQIKFGRPAFNRHISFAAKDYNEGFRDKIEDSAFKYDQTMFFLILLNLYDEKVSHYKTLPPQSRVNFSNEYQKNVYGTYREIKQNRIRIKLVGKTLHTFDFTKKDQDQSETFEKHGGVIYGRSDGHNVFPHFIPREADKEFRELADKNNIFDRSKDMDREFISECKNIIKHFNWRYLMLGDQGNILKGKKDFCSTIIHEKTHDKFPSKKLSNEFGRKNWGPIDEGAAQFVELLVERKFESSDGSTVDMENLDLSLYEGSFDTYQWGEWVMKLLDERISGKYPNGKVDDVRNLIHEYIEEEKERSEHHPINFFKFIMPPKTKKIIENSDKLFNSINAELTKLEESFSNKNMPQKRIDTRWKGALKKSGFGTYDKLRKEIERFKRKTDRYEEIMHKEVIKKAVTEKEDFHFVEKKFNEVLKQEMENLLKLIKDLKKLKSHLDNSWPEWKGLNRFIEDMQEYEKELEEEIKFIERRNRVANA